MTSTVVMKLKTTPCHYYTVHPSQRPPVLNIHSRGYKSNRRLRFYDVSPRAGHTPLPADGNRPYQTTTRITSRRPPSSSCRCAPGVGVITLFAVYTTPFCTLASFNPVLCPGVVSLGRRCIFITFYTSWQE